MPDPSGMTDDDLKAALLEYGEKAGPIVGEVALYSILKLVFIVEIGFPMHVHLLFSPVFKKTNDYSIVCLC